MNALVPKPPERMPLAYAEIERLAVSIAKSGLFGMKTPDQAMALMMIATRRRAPPSVAARDYDVIQARPPRKPRLCCATSSRQAAGSNGTR